MGIGWWWLGCQRPGELPSSEDYALEELVVSGEVRSDGEVVLASVSLGAPGSYVQLGDTDELVLMLPDGQQTFQQVLGSQHVAQLTSSEIDGSIVISRGEEVVDFPFSLPAPFALTVEPPQSEGEPIRITSDSPGSLGPSGTMGTAAYVILEGLCLSWPQVGSLPLDQVEYEIPAETLPVVGEPCELWVTWERTFSSGLLTTQSRTVSFTREPAAGSTP